jgi:RNA polymerase sigma-70 factor, ECF subfamily
MRSSDRTTGNGLLEQILASGHSSDSNQSSQNTAHTSRSQQEVFERNQAEIVDLFKRHSSALGRYAGSLTRDAAVVQDAIQEAFLRYFKTLVAGQIVENPRAWLFHVLRNYVLNWNRKCKFTQSVELDEASDLADIKQDVEAAYETNQAFRLAISTLSPRERECVQLKIEGFGHQEIAQILGIRSNTVSATLTRSLKKIRRTGIFSRMK